MLPSLHADARFVELPASFANLARSLGIDLPALLAVMQACFADATARKLALFMK